MYDVYVAHYATFLMKRFFFTSVYIRTNTANRIAMLEGNHIRCSIPISILASGMSKLLCDKLFTFSDFLISILLR